MRYRVKIAFFPDVIVGQIIERSGHDGLFRVHCHSNVNEFNLQYIKSHPEIFEPVEERWKPIAGCGYYSVYVEGEDDINMHIREAGTKYFDRKYDIGNCFETEEQASEATKRIKELLLNYHEEINEKED